MKFVSAFGVLLLTSVWISLWFFTISNVYCLILGKKEKPPAVFTPAKLVLQVSQDLSGRGAIGSLFSFLVVLQGWGLTLSYNHSAQFSAHAFRALCSHTVHSAYLHQASTNNPSGIVTL